LKQSGKRSSGSSFYDNLCSRCEKRNAPLDRAFWDCGNVVNMTCNERKRSLSSLGNCNAFRDCGAAAR
jgi:hypothetical protein